jgi:hypothetical protein
MLRPKLREREVWDAAVVLIAKHGVKAPGLARLRAGQLQGQDALTAKAWRIIADAAAEIVRSRPQIGERVH